MNRDMAAYKQGKEAKARQYERVSPYTNLKAEKYWYAGYDGIPYRMIEQENG